MRSHYQYAPSQQLPDAPTKLENTAIQANGDFLATKFAPTPVLCTVRFPITSKSSLEVLHGFKTITRILGIAETLADTFLVVGDNATANTAVTSAQGLNFSSSTHKVRKIVDVPDTMFLNVVVAFPDAPDVVLIADSQLGVLFRLDTKSRASECIADRPEFKPHAEKFNETVGFEINGPKVRDGYLYYNNINLIEIYQVQPYPAPGCM